MVKSELTNMVIDFGTRKSNARSGKVIGITIHHMAGRMLADDCAKSHLYSDRQSSANYYIGYDGQICAGVSEDRRAWTSNSRANDYSHITIEVSDADSAWNIPQKAYDSLVKLCADICCRYNIGLHYDRSKGADSTLSIHNMFVATLCPGQDLIGKVESGQFEKDVKAAMGADIKPVPTSTMYRVQVGAFEEKKNADAMAETISKAGYDMYMIKVGSLYKVQVGAFAEKENAERLLADLKSKGFDAFISTEAGIAVKAGSGKKDLTEIAYEIYMGKWGNDPIRTQKLREAGYDPKEVQHMVNKMYY